MGKANHNRTKGYWEKKMYSEPTTFYARALASKPWQTPHFNRFGNYANLTSEKERKRKNQYHPMVVIGNNR